jgi:CBS domain-containing protein
MVAKRYHRLFVTQAGTLAGVLSTRELMLAVCDAEIAEPLAKYATKPVHTIDSDRTLVEGIEKLTTANVSGLVVMEDGMPSGLFTQLEALASRDMPAETKISEVVEYSVICLPWRTPLYRAAGFAANSRARRVLTMDGTEVRGIVTALDFVKAAIPK